MVVYGPTGPNSFQMKLLDDDLMIKWARQESGHCYLGAPFGLAMNSNTFQAGVVQRAVQQAISELS
jgi:hypothetical protein